MDTIEKIYTPQIIEETPFPQEGVTDISTQQSTSNDTFSPQTIKDNGFPDKRVAHELITNSLNTKSKKILQEYQFTESGALQIGKYVNGESGDIRISPSGIVARNTAGAVTVSIDGETGDAVFAGTLQTGTLIAGIIVVGNNTWVIDGDPRRPQLLLYNNGIPEILIGEE